MNITPGFTSLLARKLNTFISLSADELKCLSDIQSAPISLARGRQFIDEGQTSHKAYVLQKGWVCSFKVLPDGGRQIVSFAIPGDYIGLGGVLLRTAVISASALTDAVVRIVDGPQFLKCVTEFPRLGAAILWAASRDDAMIVDHLVNIGRRTAIQRMGHFFLELSERLCLVGLATETEFRCPLSQFLIADALGLTAIHVNRTLRQLRENNLVTVRTGSVVIHDTAALKKLSGFQSQRDQKAHILHGIVPPSLSNENAGDSLTCVRPSQRKAL